MLSRPGQQDILTGADVTRLRSRRLPSCLRASRLRFYEYDLTLRAIILAYSDATYLRACRLIPLIQHLPHSLPRVGGKLSLPTSHHKGCYPRPRAGVSIIEGRGILTSEFASCSEANAFRAMSLVSFFFPSLFIGEPVCLKGKRREHLEGTLLLDFLCDSLSLPPLSSLQRYISRGSLRPHRRWPELWT